MNSNDEFADLTPEEKLRSENEILKLKLQAEFGMDKMDSSLNDVPENEWLNYIYNFEKQYAEHRRCKVYDFIQRPEFRKADELTKDEISDALVRLTDIMQSNSLDLATICDYEDEVIYRFITEELFDHEMDDMRIPGMMHCFTYEEFHPNHDYDIRKQADEFIDLLICKRWDDFMNNILLYSTVSYNGHIYLKESFQEIIRAFQAGHKTMELEKWEVQTVGFDLQTATATLRGYIEYKSADAPQIIQGPVNLEFKMKYDYWNICKVILPGFSK